MTGSFDVVVVGAGPGGIAAAVVAATAGKRVCLLDNNPQPGGQIWRGYEPRTALRHPYGKTYIDWRARLEDSGRTVLSGSEVIAQPAPGVLRIEHANQPRDLRYDRLILATGARERFLPFPGWTLPGVMGAGGAQAMVKSGMDAKGKRIVVAGSGPLLLAAAAGLSEAGASVKAIYEQAPLSQLTTFGLTMLRDHPGKLVEGVGYKWKTVRAAYRTGTWVVRAEGRDKLESVVVTNGRKTWTIACDWLACGFNLIPNLELPRLFGCRIVGGRVAVDELQYSSVPGVACIGELTGVGGLDKALVEGQIAGWVAADHPEKASAFFAERAKLHRFAARLERAFALRRELRTLASPDTVVCRCEDVRHAAVAASTSWRAAKLHTRCGMGACQGRVCGGAVEFLFGWEGTGMRPPVFPTSVSTLAADVKAPSSVSA